MLIKIESKITFMKFVLKPLANMSKKYKKNSKKKMFTTSVIF